MELVLSISYDPSSLARYPREFNPFAAVRTTDPHQAQNTTPGTAVTIVPLTVDGKDSKGNRTLGGKQPVVLYPSPLGKSEASDRGEDALFALMPTRNLAEDLCISIFTRSMRSDGSKDDPANAKVNERLPFLHDIPADKRAYTTCQGQVNIPMHVIARFLISDGIARLAAEKELEHLDGDARPTLFPTTTVKGEVESLATKEGVNYRIEAINQSQGRGGATTLAIELSKMGADNLMKKGMVYVLAGLLATSDKTKAMTLRERVDLLIDYYVDKAPLSKKDRKRHRRVGVEVASKAYDKETYEHDRMIREALERYEKRYDDLWSAVDNGGIRVGDSLLRPEKPSMARFRLPFWINGKDKFPFAEWWLRTLVSNAPHLRRATIHTERFLKNMLDMGIKRAGLTEAEFTETLSDLLYKIKTVPKAKLRQYLDKKSSAWARFVRCIEATFYAIMMPAHACRYSSDARYVNALLRLLRVDVESPQQDTAAGVADDGDCEDLQKLIIITWIVLLTGRDGGDSVSRGRGWSDPTLAAARHLLEFYCDFNVFGSVRGAQLSDANADDEEGLIGTPEDLVEDIGGHMFGDAAPLAVVARRYTANRKFVRACMEDVRDDPGEVVSARVEVLLSQWTDAKGEEREILRKLWEMAPCLVFEPTGRQETLLMPMEKYFGLSEETLRRVAERASMIEVLHRWPHDKPHKHHHKASTMFEQQMKSMGEASPYMFQKRILSKDSFKQDARTGRLIPRHLSAFYREKCHTVSVVLNMISPAIFGHMIFTRPSRSTYGVPLRMFIDNDSDDAVPIPLPKTMRYAYLLDAEGRRSTKLEDAFMKYMRRIIPYDIGFDHLTPVEGARPMITSKSFASSSAAFSGQEFFCHDHSLDVLSNASLSLDAGSELIIKVPSTGAVAMTMASLYGPERREWSTTVKSRIISRNAAGVTSADQIATLWRHIAAGQGVSNAKVFTERVLPWFSDNACAYFDRKVKFVIADPAEEQYAYLSSAARVYSNALSTTIPTRVDIKSIPEEIKRLAVEMEIDLTVLPLERLIAGYEVEREHGRKQYLEYLANEPRIATFDVTQDNIGTTLQIALAHFAENPGLRKDDKIIIPDYYEALEKMELQSSRLWGVRDKPNIFLHRDEDETAGTGGPVLSFAQHTMASLYAYGTHNM